MRELIWFTVGFGAACGISAYLLEPVFLLIPVLLLTGAGFWYFRKKSLFQYVGLVLIGLCLGTIWFLLFSLLRLEPVYSMDGVTQNTEIRCSDYSQKTDYGHRTTGTVSVRNKPYPVIVYLNEKTEAVPGTVLSGEFLFKVTAPGGQKESSYFQGEGIFLLAYPKDELTLTNSDRIWRDIPAIMRQKFLAMLEQSLPKEGFAFAKALALGDNSGLDYATLTDLTVSGVRHIVAVSGLHVSILFGMLGFITFRRRFLTALIGFPALFLFAAMTGFTPSVCRACLMCGLMLLASILNREYDGLSALAFAGLVLLLVNPLVISSASYQLSFASVTGILTVSPVIRNGLLKSGGFAEKGYKPNKILRGVITSVSATLGATAATLPLCAVYFRTVSLAAVLTNLLVLWAVSVIFYGLLAMCLLGSVWPAVGVLLGKAVTVLIRYVLLTAKVVADFPLSAVYTKSPYITVWFVFIYVLLIAFLLSESRKVQELVSGLVLSLSCALLLSWMEPLWSDVRFSVLDVGEGQCVLMQTEGKSYLVDCGGSSDASAADAAAETLLSQGISRLDGLILTHYDQDHAGGLENLLSRIDVDLLILPPEYSRLQLDADQILYAAEDLTVSSGTSNISVYSAKAGKSRNENSLCILFDTKNCDILITGDRNFAGEHQLLENAEIGDVDVLVAGHHGAEDSTGEELLSAVRPEIVCISVSEDNSYGHPGGELLARLETQGCTVFRTEMGISR